MQDPHGALHDRYGQQRARALAQPQAEVDQGAQAQVVQGDPGAGLDGQVPGDAGADRAGGQGLGSQGGGGGDDAVEDDRYPGAGRAQDQPGQPGVFKPPDGGQGADAVGGVRLVQVQGAADACQEPRA